MKGGVHGSRCGHRKRTNVLSNGTCILLINVERSYLHIDERGLDIGMPHQLHECWQTNAGPYHVGGEGVPEAVRISDFHSRGPAMITEQRMQACRCHAGAACGPFKDTNSAAPERVGRSSRT